MHFCHQELQMILVAFVAMFPFLNFIVKPCCKSLLEKYHKDHSAVKGTLDSMGKTETSFMCKCGAMEGWIQEGKITMPCPICYRRYKGVYNKKECTLVAKEI